MGFGKGDSAPEGVITGLQIFNTIAGNNILGKYIGDSLDFLKGKQSWKGSKLAYVDVWYKNGLAKLSNGNLKLKECRLLFDGAYNTNSKGLDVNLELELLKERIIARPALDVYLFFWTGHFSGASGSGWPIKTRNFVLTDFAAAFIRTLVFLKNSQSIVIFL